jgi:hypothetical protein
MYSSPKGHFIFPKGHCIGRVVANFLGDPFTPLRTILGANFSSR